MTPQQKVQLYSFGAVVAAAAASVMMGVGKLYVGLLLLFLAIDFLLHAYRAAEEA